MTKMNYNLALQISQNTSYWLRHNPTAANIEIDENGWASIKEIINALDSKNIRISPNDLIELNQSFSKSRWEFESSKIRAKYGHSIPVKQSA